MTDPEVELRFWALLIVSIVLFVGLLIETSQLKDLQQRVDQLEKR